MAKLLVIITGSIAAYKSIDLVRELEKKGHEISIILTESAKHFVSPLTYSSLTKAIIYNDYVFEDSDYNPMLHIELAKNHELVLVVPVTADYIAKMTIGLGDTLSLCTLLVNSNKVLIAPAMNPNMLSHPATQNNLAALRDRNVEIAEPIYGSTACKDIGYGKYIGNEVILELVDKMLYNNGRLKGIKVTITLGSTKEMLDPVRFIGNTSSGKLGTLIASRLIREGAEVTIIAGNISCELPLEARVIRAFSAEEMLKSSLSELPTDIFIGCAAICDYKPLIYSQNKIKKKIGENIVIELTPNPDVIATIAGQTKEKRPQFVVGFALESENYIENAKNKLKYKNLDLLVLNKVAFLEESFNDYTLVYRDYIKELGRLEKPELATTLVEVLINKLQRNS